MSDILFISNDGPAFQTLEGEGPNAGKNAVFTRLAMCNLTCKGWASPENPFGCDSYISWSKKNKYTFEELFAFFEERNYHQNLQRGDLWKLTGGEPLIQQKALLEFVKQATDRWELYSLVKEDYKTFVEFETNATILPDPRWLEDESILPVRFVCSPKLSNNGDPEEKRYKPDVLFWHAFNASSIFKFVVTSASDLEEIKTKYVDQLNIDPKHVWLMPEGATTASLKAKAPWVADICKKEGFNFSNRLQVFIWEQTLGV